MWMMSSTIESANPKIEPTSSGEERVSWRGILLNPIHPGPHTATLQHITKMAIIEELGEEDLGSPASHRGTDRAKTIMRTA